MEYQRFFDIFIETLNKHDLKKSSGSDVKKSWQIIKPLFSNQVEAKTVIKFVENNEMTDDDIETAKLFKIGLAPSKKKMCCLLD